jgi:threonine dehydrogenase-like Zn-dependent dehydrogenase
MIAAVVVEPGRVELLDVPEPSPGPYQVRVRTLAGGLCGTDRHIVNGTFYRREFPAIIGHESLGQVVETGNRVRNFSCGDMILRTAAVLPGDHLGRFGSNLGAFAEWALATDVEALVEEHPDADFRAYVRMQKIVPDVFDPLDAGAFIVLKETFSWLRKLGDPAGRRVLIVGTGPAALAFLQIAKLQRAKQIMVVGRRRGRLDHAQTLGADEVLMSPADELPGLVRAHTDGHGADLVIEAAGASDVLEVIPDCLASGATVGVYGISARQSATIRWGWERSVPRSWSLRFEEPDEAGIHDEAWKLVQSGQYQLKSTLTHVVPFSQIVEAFQFMTREEACKVAIDFRDSALPR